MAAGGEQQAAAVCPGEAVKMNSGPRYVVGTSGYSFADWVGTFYPADTKTSGMFAQYVRHFDIVELNFTYYRIPTPRTLEAIAGKSPPGFSFWVKANQETTHRQNRTVAPEFVEALSPLRTADKLAGVLMQFPQSFGRTKENRRYLAAAIEDFASVPLAVEFRHRSWDHQATFTSLADRNVTLVVPDVPDLEGLFRIGPAATTPTGYLRLHSRNAHQWYAGMAKRYDYDYSKEELQDIARDWARGDEPLDMVYVFFNNCHGGQAARNAEAFRRIVGQID